MQLADGLNPRGVADTDSRWIGAKRWVGAKMKFSAPVAIAAAVGILGAAGEARASFVLDTGTPAGSSELILSTSESYAAEFQIAAGETVSSLAAYLMPNTGSANSFEFEIFSNSPTFIGARPPTLVYSVTAMVTATAGSPGWNSVAANWTPTTGGDYWLAILETNTGTTLDVQSETSTGTGTAPALAFASTNTPGTRYAALGTGIGLEVTAVPLPAAAWLMLSGLAGLGTLVRKRKAA
jgi:hypothetical protein